MPPGQLDALAAAASDVTFPAGHRVFADGGFAGKFWLIQSGHVALDVHVPGSGRVTIDSIGIGDLLGCSWLFPPYRWAFGAVCVTALSPAAHDEQVRSLVGSPHRRPAPGRTWLPATPQAHARGRAKGPHGRAEGHGHSDARRD